MSAMQRRKGANFERKIVRMLKARLPHATIRRGKQSHLADECDVPIVGAGDPWDSLWMELQDARRPTPRLKLAQAIADAQKAAERDGKPRLPMVVWHRLGERTIQVTCPEWVLESAALDRGMTFVEPGAGDAFDHLIVNMDFADLLAVLP